MIRGIPAITNTFSTLKARRAAHGVVDQVSKLGRFGHFQARLGYLNAHLGNAFAQNSFGFWIADQFLTESLGHTAGGDVVMGRADAAGREDIVIFGPAGIERLNDFTLDISHHAGFTHLDAELVQLCAEEWQVCILGPA